MFIENDDATFDVWFVLLLKVEFLLNFLISSQRILSSSVKSSAVVIEIS
jgi:hypothetical protein